MFSYAFYKNLHLVGVFMVLLALGGALVAQLALSSAGPGRAPFPPRARKFVGMTHGLGLTISLVGGFGTMARLGLAQGEWPGWIGVKLVIWFVLGGMIAVIYRKPDLAKPLWWLALALGGTAAFMAINKPF